jgi:hypothetical protein
MTDRARRKELKSAYEETALPAGVYRITNAAVGRTLIASTTNLTAARNRFDFAVAQRMTGALDQRLKRDVQAHGFDGLSFEVVETLDPDPDATAETLAAELKTLEALVREQFSETELY